MRAALMWFLMSVKPGLAGIPDDRQQAALKRLEIQSVFILWIIIHCHDQCQGMGKTQICRLICNINRPMSTRFFTRLLLVTQLPYKLNISQGMRFYFTVKSDGPAKKLHSPSPSGRVTMTFFLLPSPTCGGR